MTAAEVNWQDAQSVANFVLWCVRTDHMQHFYRTWQWRKTRNAVLVLDHHECQLCRAKGRYTKATVAHHVHYLKARPDLALAIWATFADGERRRNIIAVCNACHELEHERTEALNGAKQKPPVTIERW
jgi:5-methylcytosine-specific restriction endonuclease McrA